MKITVVKRWMDATKDMWYGPTTRIVMDVDWDALMDTRAAYGSSLINDLLGTILTEEMNRAIEEYKTRSVGPMEESSLESCPVCDEQAKVRFLHAPPPEK